MRKKIRVQIAEPNWCRLSPMSRLHVEDTRPNLSLGQRLQSNTYVHSTTDLETSLTMPEPSRASRSIALRSTASFRGSIVDLQRNREFNFESKLERDHLHIILAHPDVAEVHEQPSAVTYVGETSRNPGHTFDVLVVMKSGTRVAVDIKPRDKVERSRVAVVQRLIRDQVGTAFADRYVVRTEDHLHPDDVADARWILRARRLANATADAAVTSLLPSMHGWCRLSDLVAATGMGAAAFNAAVRSVADGLIEVRDRARISLDCLVRRARG